MKRRREKKERRKGEGEKKRKYRSFLKKSISFLSMLSSAVNSFRWRAIVSIATRKRK